MNESSAGNENKYDAFIHRFGDPIFSPRVDALRAPPALELLNKLDVEYVTLKELLQLSNVVTIHIPLTP